MAFDDGAKQVLVTGGPVDYYTSYASTNLYVAKSFGATLTSITIQNTHASDSVQISWDGAALAGDLSAGESITLNSKGKSAVYLKSTAGLATIRCWGF